MEKSATVLNIATVRMHNNVSQNTLSAK